MFHDLYTAFTANQVAVAFLIIALGYAIGRFEFRGITLGASGVLFVALIFGHFGFTIPSALTDLGIILFVYMVGLQSGPRFFTTFKRRGFAFAILALLIIAAGLAASIVSAYVFGISPALTAGIFAGAMTSTPALATAIETSKSALASIGYGVSYPFGVIGIILFVQVFPRIMRINLEEAASSARKESNGEKEKIVKKVLIVQNPAMDGKEIRTLHLHKFSNANITRIRRGEQVLPVKPESPLRLGDRISVVGAKNEIDTLKLLLGEETEDQEIYASRDVIYRDAFISERQFAGKTLSQLNVMSKYGIVITRIKRDGMEFTPTGHFVLEIGDSVRIVGDKADCERFVHDVGQHEKHVHETNVLTFAAGIVLGSLLGFTPVELPGGITFRLGLAGGPLLVALLFSHFGRIGRFNIRVPYGAKFILRELGLVFFLAGAGASAGAHMLEIISTHGTTLLVAGSMVTCFSILVAYVAGRYIFGLNLLTLLGVVCGGMTSTPALGVVMQAVDSEEPAIAYTSIYPIALILMTIGAQLLVLIL